MKRAIARPVSPVRDRLARHGLDALHGTPEQFTRQIDTDIVKWGAWCAPAT